MTVTEKYKIVFTLMGLATSLPNSDDSCCDNADEKVGYSKAMRDAVMVINQLADKVQNDEL
jgi:hypothetical protein